MSPSPDNFSATTANGVPRFTRGRAPEMGRAGQENAQQNPLPMVFGALAIGVVVGLLCGRREPKPREAGQRARELWDEAAAQLARRLPWGGSRPRGPLWEWARKWQGGR